MPVYIGKVEIWLGVTDASHTHSQTTEYSATQLVSSIKFKLSHAISTFSNIYRHTSPLLILYHLIPSSTNSSRKTHFSQLNNLSFYDSFDESRTVNLV